MRYNIKINKLLSSISFACSIIFISIITTASISAEEIEDSNVENKPVISKIQAQYINNQGELFIYGSNFGKEESDIVLSLKPEGKDEIIINIEGVYNSIINSNILESFDNGEITVKIKDGSGAIASSNSVFFDFKLPNISKIYTENVLGPGEYITIEGENFRKPSYGTMGGNKYICEDESSTLCKFKIPANEDVNGKIGISSFGFNDESEYELSNNKVPDIDILGTSSNLFVAKINNFDFKQLREIPETEKEQEANKRKTRSGIKMIIDGKDFSDCEINTLNELSCIGDSSIYYKGVGYVEIFGAKSALFPYEIHSMPLVTNYKTYRKWGTVQTRDPSNNESLIIKGNILHFEIGLINFNYSKKNNLSIFIDGKEYSLSDKNLTLEKKKAIIKLNQLPDDQGEIYLTNKSESILDASEGIEVKSNIIPYDIGKYLPEIYEISTTGNDNEFYITGNNLTNFDNLKTIVNFGDLDLSSDAIEKIAEEQKEDNIKKIKKAEDELANATGNDRKDLQYLISSLKSINDDINNGIYEKSISQKALKIGEIVTKSDEKIIFKAFDKDEYGKTIEKGEYEVYVNSNGKNSNKINFFFNPAADTNISYPYPTIEKIDFINGAGDTSKIKLKGQFLQFVKEIYLGDEKVSILTSSNDSIVLEIPDYVQKKGPITAKLINNKLTNTLYVYEFYDDISNQIDISWKKIDMIENENEDADPEAVLVIKNLYKNAIIKSLKLFVSSDLYENDKLPFYQIALEQDNTHLADGLFENNNLILFENSELEKAIEIDENNNVELLIDFIEVDRAYGDYKIKLIDIEFYDESQIPNLIPASKIKYEKEPFYYVIKSGDSKLCIEKIESDKWLKCGESQWLTGYENGIFEQEAFKSVIAPKKDTKRRALFSDLHTSYWYYEYVQDLYQRGIIEGYVDRSFRGGKNITRGEAIKMLITTIGEIVPEYNKSVESFAFEDIDENYWGKDMLEYAVRREFLRPSRNFRPNKYISRAESAKLIIKFFGRSVQDSSNNYFNDTSDHWVRPYSQYLYENKIVSGVSNKNIFNPEGLLTRAEFSKMISKSISLWAE